MAGAQEWLNQCYAETIKRRHPRATVPSPTAEFISLVQNDMQPGLRAECETIRKRCAALDPDRCHLSKVHLQILNRALAPKERVDG